MTALPTAEALFPSVHASAVLVGDRAVLIRGPSGSGKSRLALQLILAGRAGQIAEATLVGDDRVRLEACGDLVRVSPVAELSGLIEVRGLGIRRIAHVDKAVVGVVLDLAAADAERLPPLQAMQTTITGIALPRIPVAAGWDAFPLLAAHLLTSQDYQTIMTNQDCWKGFGNHIRPTLATD